MIRLADWLLRDGHLLSLIGALHFIIGMMHRVYFNNPIEGLLFMIVGLLMGILAKMEDRD